MKYKFRGWRHIRLRGLPSQIGDGCCGIGDAVKRSGVLINVSRDSITILKVYLNTTGLQKGKEKEEKGRDHMRNLYNGSLLARTPVDKTNKVQKELRGGNEASEMIRRL
jgi:hypothetical protein